MATITATKQATTVDSKQDAADAAMLAYARALTPDERTTRLSVLEQARKDAKRAQWQLSDMVRSSNHAGMQPALSARDVDMIASLTTTYDLRLLAIQAETRAMLEASKPPKKEKQPKAEKPAPAPKAQASKRTPARKTGKQPASKQPAKATKQAPASTPAPTPASDVQPGKQAIKQAIEKYVVGKHARKQAPAPTPASATPATKQASKKVQVA